MDKSCYYCFGLTQCNMTFHQVQTTQLLCRTRTYLFSHDGGPCYFFLRLETVAESYMQLVMFYYKLKTIFYTFFSWDVFKVSMQQIKRV